MLYLGGCTGASPPTCQTCDDGCGTEFSSFAYGGKTELAEGAPCAEFAYSPIDFFTVAYASLPNPACLDIPEAEVVDLDWHFEWPFVAGTITVDVSMDKSAYDTAVYLGASWSVTLSDPGGAAQYDSESVYSEWVEITGARRRFRIRIDFAGAHDINGYGCMWEGEYTVFDYRDLEANAGVSIEWQLFL